MPSNNDALSNVSFIALLLLYISDIDEISLIQLLIFTGSGLPFASTLSSEEINILALLMKQGWIQRQVSSVENIRMKYSGSDFKMTSQANHLQKLLSLLEESRRDEFHH